MTPEIRPVREDELPAYIDALSTGFLERPDVARVAREIWPLWQGSRSWAAIDDGRICGTFRSWPTELTVPGGGRLAAAAVSAVTVLPTHRRRGILRAMVRVEHDAIREQGDALALLFASEYPIYGRFGYGPATREATWTLDATRTGFVEAAGGSVELAGPSPETRDAVIAVFEAWRKATPGEIRRRSVSWDFALGLREEFWGEPWKGFLVLHRDAAGAVDGYARYHVEAKWEQRQPTNTIVVDELHALTISSEAGLWRFLAEIDWVTTIKAARRSPSDRLPWFVTNARAAMPSEVGDAVWVRVFDLPRALEVRSYEHEARVVLEVVDPETPHGRVRVDLDATRDGATCRPTDRSPDLTIDAAALGAAYLGGTRLRDSVLAAGADEHRSGALRDVDRLLRTADEPWCSTFF